MLELIWISAALLAGLLASRLFFPPLVGYLAAGYALHYFKIQALPNLAHLADIGIQLLLFTVGLKLKARSLLRKEVLSVGGLHLLLMASVSALVFFWLDQRVTGGLILGVSLSFSSTVLAIKVLEDSGELSALHGRDVLSILILQDIVAIGLLAYAEGEQPQPWAAALFLLPLLRPITHRLLTACHSAELKLLLGVTLALAGGVLAEHVGVAADIGALLTGLTLAGHPSTTALANKLWGIKELFLVAFFLQIGLTDLPGREQFVIALQLLAMLPLQGLMFFGLFLFAGLRARNAFVSALVLMTYSEFALITTGAVVKAGLLPDEWQAIISLAVAGSLAIAAPLNRFSQPLFAACETFLIKFEKPSGHPDRLPDCLGVAEWLVIGMGDTGISAYQTLANQEQRVVGLDADPTVLERLLADGRRVVYGDAEDSSLLSRLPLERIKGIVLAVPSLEVRTSAISLLRKRGFLGLIGTVGGNAEEALSLQQQGADFVIQPLLEAGKQLAKQITGNRTPQH
ncbi:cation:proton antiporter [Methylomonas paludis]|uniref:Cation:proton antiporter n=1 Tax=Methylomonas paludis TaxID=1173101 RepID=A0A975MLT8_9GAMM|nr:cation:proton antiporter family protein [Methylomonas paludis]QWF69974.1 cation:proton antiporter [Methylomonas paludis]